VGGVGRAVYVPHKARELLWYGSAKVEKFKTRRCCKQMKKKNKEREEKDQRRRGGGRRAFQHYNLSIY
jgi:hypothetical protein